jgi:hypothetical protein
VRSRPARSVVGTTPADGAGHEGLLVNREIRLAERDPPHRARGHRPEQAVDEAIARIKQILSE